jgi:hypothetical protein
MPGKGGIRPDQRRRSVPVLMPLQATSTTTSASPGSASSSRLRARSSGSCISTATVSIRDSTRLPPRASV